MGALVGVDRDEAVFGLDSDLIQFEGIRHRLAANGTKENVCMNLFRFAIAVSQHQIDSRGGRGRFLQFGGDHAANAMLLEGALKFSGALMVFNG